MHFKLFFTSLFLFLFLTSFQTIDTIKGKVVSIKDGDSIVILTTDTKQIEIRLEGIDCPEKGQDFGNRAKQFTSNLVMQQNVTVQTSGLDGYGRTLGYVFLSDGTNLNHELLKAGLAWHFVKYNKDPDLATLENTARSNKIGLWSHTNPTAPWDWRASKSENYPSVGESATLCEPPVQIVQNNKNRNIYINYGDKHPNQPFSAIILSKDLNNFPSDIFQQLQTNTFCINGTVSEHRNKSQIKLTHSNQIELQ